MVINCDIWDLQKTHLIVIPVNLRGVMGRGIAKQYADKYPAGAKWFRMICTEPWFEKGKPLPTRYTWECAAIMLPVKSNWPDKASPQMIEAGLYNLKTFLNQYVSREYPRERVALPVVGAGYGGLSVGESIKLIVKTLGQPEHSPWFDLIRAPYDTLAPKYPESFRPGSRRDKPMEKAILDSYEQERKF